MQGLSLKKFQSISILFLFVLLACAPGAGPGGIPGPVAAPTQGANDINISNPLPVGGSGAQPQPNAGGPDAGGAEEKNPGETESESGHGGQDNVAGLPGGGTHALPQNSIPAPSLKKEKVLAFAPDASPEPASDRLPMVGFPGAVECTPGNQCFVAVSENPIVASRSSNQSSIERTNPVFARNGFAQSPFNHHFKRAIASIAPTIPIVYAQSISDPTLLCDEFSQVSCCPVASNGSFECYYRQTNRSVAQLYILAIDSNGEPSFAEQENVQNNILWFQEEPKGLAGNTTNRLFALTQDNIGLEIFRPTNVINARYAVQGDFLTQYQALPSNQTTDAEGIAFSLNQVALRRPIESVRLVDVPPRTNPLGQAGGGVSIGLAPSRDVTVPEADRYEVLKKTSDGKLRFGIRQRVTSSTSNNYGRIYHAPDILSERIWFVGQGDQDAAGQQITHRQTLAFDVDQNNCALVVFQDLAGNVRLRGACPHPRDSSTTVRFGGDGSEPLTNNPANSFVDLVIYQSTREDISTTTFGIRNPHYVYNVFALLIDKNTNSAWQLTFTINTSNSANNSITTSLTPNNAIQVGNQPVAIALNPAKTQAYVVNEGDETMSVINLPTQGRIPTVLRTVPLQNQLPPNKQLGIAPNGIVYQQAGSDATTNDDYLIVSTKSLKGGIVIRMDSANFLF